MRSFVARHRLACFIALAFALSWYPWVIAIVQGRTTGPNPLGPLVAALIVTGLSGGFRELLKSIVRARVGWLPYAIVIALPLAFYSISAAVAGTHLNASGFVERFLFIFLFVALGEEPGWRGFLLPELERKFSSNTASWIVAAVWGVWHIPLFGSEFKWEIVPAFLVSVAGVTFFMTWLSHRTGGSVLLPMILHALVNTIAANVQISWWTNAALWAVAGLLASRSVHSKIVLPSPAHEHVLVDLGSSRPRPSGR